MSNNKKNQRVSYPKILYVAEGKTTTINEAKNNKPVRPTLRNKNKSVAVG